jgi:hypothetical protein
MRKENAFCRSFHRRDALMEAIATCSLLSTSTASYSKWDSIQRMRSSKVSSPGFASLGVCSCQLRLRFLLTSAI